MAGGSPQADLRPGRFATGFFTYETKEEAPRTTKQKSTTNPGPPHKQPGKFLASKIMCDQPTSRIMYVQEAYPQAELPRGSWLAGWLVVLRPGSLRLAGWLRRPREAEDRRPREAQRGGAGMEQACHAFGWKLPQADLRPGRFPTDFFTEPWRKPPADYYGLGFKTEFHFKPSASPQAELCMFVCYACTTRRLPTSRITTGEVELRPGR